MNVNVYHRYAHSPSFTSTIVIIWLFPVGFQNNCTLRFVSRHIFLLPIVRSFSRVSKVKCECFWIHSYLEINSSKYLGKTEFRITSDNIFCMKMKSWCFYKRWDTCERTKFNHRNNTNKYWGIHFRFKAKAFAHEMMLTLTPTPSKHSMPIANLWLLIEKLLKTKSMQTILELYLIVAGASIIPHKYAHNVPNCVATDWDCMRSFSGNFNL